MKILHVTKKYVDVIGGDSFVVSNLEKQQSAVGNKVIILTSNCKEIRKSKNVYKFGLEDSPASLDAITIKRLVSLIALFFIAFKILKKERPDIIHTHSVDMAFIVSFAAMHYGIPLVHTFHTVTFNDPQQSFLRRSIELFLLKNAKPKKIFILNPADLSDFNKNGFMNVQFVPNGANIDEWNHDKKQKKNKRFTFIAVGRLEEQKGFAYLIKAATLLKKEGKDFQIQIIGDGSQFELLSRLVEENRLEDTVFLFGRKSHEELRELYSKAHVFVLPSWWEEFPLTLLEAWASLLPVVITNVGAVNEICKNEVNALIIKPSDMPALTQAMKKIMNHSSLAETLAKNGYGEVLEKFRWEKITQIITKAYGE